MNSNQNLKTKDEQALDENGANTMFLEIIYDGNPIGLTREDAITLAQKGMNYDRLYSKCENMAEEINKSKAIADKVYSMASSIGVTPEAMLESFDNEMNIQEINTLAKSRNVPPESAKEMLELKKRLSELENERREYEIIKKRQDDLAMFGKAYPDEDLRALSPEVIKEWEKSGKPLVDVYNAHIAKEYMLKRMADTANTSNRQATAGSATGIPDMEEQYTDDMLMKMSDEELNKNFKKILKQIK